MFEMALRVDTAAEPHSGPSLGPADSEGTLALLDYVCSSLVRLCQVELRIGGFGQPQWPVDLPTDLTILLEQLPNAIFSARTHEEFKIEFYEQSILRTVRFTPVPAGFLVSCVHFLTEEAIDQSVTVPQLDVLRILTRVMTSFSEAVKWFSGELTERRLFKLWKQGTFE